MSPRRLRFAALLGALLMLAARLPAADLVATIERVAPSVVAVGYVERHLKQVRTVFSGTGFVVGDGTRVITNHHVYQGIERNGERQISVFSGRGRQARVWPVRLVRADPVHDLVLLELVSGRLPPLELAGDRLVPEGTDVAFTGFPIGMVLGLYPVTHRGMVSSITPLVIPADSARRLTAEQIRRIRRSRFDVYQLDGTAYPGNSGSPVYLPGSGAVIGVINSVFVKGTKEAALEKPSGITYAIPVRHVRALMAPR